MTRKLMDDEGERWDIELLPADEQNEDVDEAMVIQFTPQSEDKPEAEIRILGPIMEDLSRLGTDDLRLALEAAQNGLGYLFLDRDDKLWWVQGPDEDVVADGMALTFMRGADELRHAGPLPAAPDDLTEDELQELLDECLGRVIG